MATTSEPIVAFGVVISPSYDSTVVATETSVAKAMTKATEIWNTLNQAIIVKVFGLPEGAKNLVKFTYDGDYNIYNLPDVATLYDRNSFSRPVEREIPEPDAE